MTDEQEKLTPVQRIGRFVSEYIGDRTGNGDAVVVDGLLDWIDRTFVVFLRRDLPEVREVDGALVASDGEDPYSARADGNPNWALNYGLNVIAVAVEMQRRQSAASAEIDALANILRKTNAVVSGGSETLAAHLFQQGVRIWDKP